MQTNVARWLTVATGLLLAGTLVGGKPGEGLVVVTSVLVPVALIRLGIGESRGAARGVVSALGLVLTLAALAVWLWPSADSPERLAAGLSVRAWIALVGLGLVPFVLVVCGYAATFRAPGGTARD